MLTSSALCKTDASRPSVYVRLIQVPSEVSPGSVFPCLCPLSPREQKLANTNQRAITGFINRCKRKRASGTGSGRLLGQSPGIAVNLSRVPAGRGGIGGHTGSPRAQPPGGRGEGRPPGGAAGRRALGPACGALWRPRGHLIQTGRPHPARDPTPRLSRRRPGLVTSGKGGAPFSKSGHGRRPRLGRRLSPGTGDQGSAFPAPGPRRGRTHRAWPPCRPRRAGSPRGRAPPAGRSTPPRRPAARAAAALCSAPWAPGRVGPEGAQPVSAPRAPAQCQEFRFGPGLRAPRRLLPGLLRGLPPPPPRRPGAGEGARPPPRLPAPAARARRRRAPPSGEAAAAGRAWRRRPAPPGLCSGG